MVSESADAYTAELQTVLRIAHALKEATAISCPPRCSPLTINNTTVETSSVNLPNPQPLFPSPLDSGITPQVASTANQIYQRRAEELKEHIQQSIAAACRKATESPAVAHVSPPDLLVKRITSILTDVYSRRLEEWKEEIIQRIRQASDLPLKAVPKNSRTFNQKYIPLLEQFFEENPFPTHADKMFFAKKSNMDYRQIHVWFQNRRNRTKKEGKMLGKKSTRECSTRSLDKPSERVKGDTVFDSHVPKPSKAGSEGPCKTEITQNDAPINIFPSYSPPHAFPSPYPPVCHYDPFPCKNGSVHFSKPEWKHSSCGKLSPPLPTSMDELVDKFSRLNVRDETRCKGSLKPPLSQAATAAITVIPPRAPHPSLLLCEYPQSANIVQRHPIVRANISSSKVFQSSSPVSKPVTLVPSSISSGSSELPAKRKTAPLPRRFPDRIHNIRRDTTPSESSSTSPTSPYLFSPNFESRSCSFSSVSSLSTPSDIASTQELPHSLGSPYRSLFAGPICLHDFGSMPAIMPSSVS